MASDILSYNVVQDHEGISIFSTLPMLIPYRPERACSLT